MASLNVASGIGSDQSDSAVLRRIKDLIRGQKLVSIILYISCKACMPSKLFGIVYLATKI